MSYTIVRLAYVIYCIHTRVNSVFQLYLPSGHINSVVYVNKNYRSRSNDLHIMPEYHTIVYDCQLYTLQLHICLMWYDLYLYSRNSNFQGINRDYFHLKEETLCCESHDQYSSTLYSRLYMHAVWFAFWGNRRASGIRRKCKYCGYKIFVRKLY